MRKLLFKILKSIAVKFRKRSYADAVAIADKLHGKTGQKVLVFFSKGEFKAVTKQAIRDGKKRGFFKGLDYSAIEKRALYVKG